MLREGRFTVARELREAQNYIPLLMLTARGRPEDVLKGFESGADDYLPKPFNLAILMARIESLLRRRSAAGLRRARRQIHPADGGSPGDIQLRNMLLISRVCDCTPATRASS